MTCNNLKTLAYNILKNFEDGLVKDLDIPELGPCSECYNEILSLPLKPFTILSCAHVYHRVCIEDKILPTMPSGCPFPGCGKIIETGEVNTRRDHSSQSSGTSSISNMLASGLNLNSPVINQDMGLNDEEVEIKVEIPSNATSKKRTNDSSVKASSSKKVKMPVKDEGSRILKRLIQELCTDIPQVSEIKEREALRRESIQGNENKIFLNLYCKISNAEKLNEDARHELIINYYDFGEELEKCLIQYKHLEEHEAQKKVNNKVKDQLPKEISKTTIRKKTERARKIYDLFFRISDDKDQRMTFLKRIKTFTASSISKLSSDNIEYVASQVRMNIRTVPLEHCFQATNF